MRRIFGHYISTAAFTLGTAEALLVTAIFCLGLSLSLGLDAHRIGAELVPMALVAALVMVAVIQSSGLHDLAELRVMRRSLKVIFWISVPVFLCAVVLTTFLARYHVVLWHDRLQWALGITAASLSAVAFARIVFVHLYEAGYFTRRIFIMGDAKYRGRIRRLAVESRGDFAIAGELDSSSLPQFFRNTTVGQPASPESLLSVIGRAGASEIVIQSTESSELPWNALLDCKLAGIRVTDYPRFSERERQRIDLDTLSAHWFVFADGFHVGAFSTLIKRAFDVAVCLAGIVISAPVMALAALAIWLETGGPVLYRQERVGLNGAVFTIFKFRSMRVDAEEAGTPKWADQADSRVTQVGAVLRKFRVDELPQFFNVLRGDMSFIGPRPERPYFVDRLSLEIPFFHQRHVIKPGITGWAQVSYQYGASVEDARQKLSFDLYYLKNRSLFLDLIILIRTVRVIIWSPGVR